MHFTDHAVAVKRLSSPELLRSVLCESEYGVIVATRLSTRLSNRKTDRRANIPLDGYDHLDSRGPFLGVGR